MKTERILLGRLLDGEHRAIVYASDKKKHARMVVDFTEETFMEVLYFLETFFSFPKEEIEYV